MDKKLNEIHENLIPTKLTTILYSTNYYYTNTKIPYNWPAFLAVNNGCTSSYALITKGHIRSNEYNIVLISKWLYSLVS